MQEIYHMNVFHLSDFSFTNPVYQSDIAMQTHNHTNSGNISGTNSYQLFPQIGNRKKWKMADTHVSNAKSEEEEICSYTKDDLVTRSE